MHRDRRSLFTHRCVCLDAGDSTRQGDNVQQHGRTPPASCSHTVRDEQSHPCAKPTKTFLNPCIVEDLSASLLHSRLPLLSYGSHVFLDAPLHSDSPHAPHTHTNSFAFSPHHPSCTLHVIIQTAHGKDDKASNTTTHWVHYTFNVLYKLLDVSLNKKNSHPND